MPGKKLMLLTAAVIAVICTAAASMLQPDEQRSVLSGTVAEKNLVQPGDKVAAGDVLAEVYSVAGGSIAAARASRSGIVSRVFVKPGDKITAEQAVAELSE